MGGVVYLVEGPVASSLRVWSMLLARNAMNSLVRRIVAWPPAAAADVFTRASGLVSSLTGKRLLLCLRHAHGLTFLSSLA